MKEKNIARIYAQSLLDLGHSKNIDIVSDLILLTETINSSNDLENILFLDIFSFEEKKSVFDEIAKKLNLNSLTVHSLLFFLEEKRFSLLPLITKECIVIDDHNKGFLKGEIYGQESSLAPEVMDKFVRYIKEKLGKTAQLTFKQDNNVTAGYRVSVGDLLLDASLDLSLEKLKTELN